MDKFLSTIYRLDNRQQSIQLVSPDAMNEIMCRRLAYLPEYLELGKQGQGAGQSETEPFGPSNTREGRSGTAILECQPINFVHYEENKNNSYLLALVLDLPLEFRPGEGYAYSNTGYALLGMIIERRSGKSFARVHEERIFHPLRTA